MIKKKKDAKLGANVVRNLLEGRQFGKIEKMLFENKFSNEGVRFLLDRNSTRFIYEVANSGYKFGDVFSSFEEYIKSDAAYKLFNDGEANSAFHWMTDYPSTSNELLNLYSSLPEDKKNVLYKNVLYKERECRLNLDLRDKYTNCCEGALELIKISLDKTMVEAIEHYVLWAAYLSKASIQYMAGIVGEKAMINMLYSRLAKKDGHYHSKNAMSDLAVILDYLDKIDVEGVCSGRTVDIIFSAICPCDWYMSNEKTEELFHIAKDIYANHAKKHIEKDLVETIRLVRGSGLKVNTSIYAYEESSEIVDQAFFFAIKSFSVTEAISEVVYLRKNKNIEPRITKTMRLISETVARYWHEVLITEDITNAAELIDYKRRVFPFKAEAGSKLSGFSQNPLLIDHINLAKFSQDDIEQISHLLSWDSEIKHYFAGGRIPFEFLMANKEKIVGCDFVTNELLKSYSISQIIELVDSFPALTAEEYMAKGIVNHIIARKEESISPEKMARILQNVRYIEPVYGNAKNSNVDLKSVLTYL